MRTNTGKEAGNMKYFIYTTVKDREGETIADGTELITALDYIRADELQDVEFIADDLEPGTAKLILAGRNKGRIAEVTIAEPEAGREGMHPYDIATRIFWHNKEMTKGQEVSFIELLGYIKLHRYEIIEKTRGNLTENVITFYNCFAGRENRRNRIEATITKLEY